MKKECFLELCSSLFDMSPEQRQALLNLLQSQVWTFDGHCPGWVKNLCRIDGQSLRSVLRAVPQDVLVDACKGFPPSLREVVYATLLPDEAAELKAAFRQRGPIRQSEADRAQQALLEAVNAGAKTGLVSPDWNGDGASAVCRDGDPEFAKRLAELDQLSDTQAAVVVATLQNRQGFDAGSVGRAMVLIDEMTPNQREYIHSHLAFLEEAYTPEEAFVFGQIEQLDDNSICRLLQEIPQAVLVDALK